MANILTQDIGGGSSKLPSKRSINLHIVESHKEQNMWVIVIFIIFMAALGFFTRFFVLDQIDRVNQAEADYNQLEQQIAAFEQYNLDYDTVREEYSHYGTDYLTDDELARQDRMAILAVIEDEPMSDGTVTNINISENVATLTMKSARLEDVSALVADVEAHDIVQYVTVASANTQDQNVRSDQATDRTVVSTMTIYFKTPADVAAEQESAAEGASGTSSNAETGSAGTPSNMEADSTGTSSDTEAGSADTAGSETGGSTEIDEPGTAGSEVSGDAQ